MLLPAQPNGCKESLSSLSCRAIDRFSSTKLFNSILTPPTVTSRIEVNFTSDSGMSWVSTDPFDLNCLSPVSSTSPFRQPPGAISKNQISSHGMPPTPEDDDPKLERKQRCTRSPGEFDVFKVQHLLDPASNRRSSGENKLSKQTSPLDLSPTNINPPLPAPVLILTPPRSLDTKNHKRIRSPLPSSQRDPRRLFGSQDTYLPWVQKVSPNRFAMNISPNMLPKGSPPAKSIWDAEDDEFDLWPTPVQAREELDTVRRNATLKRNTFVRPPEPNLSMAEQIALAVETPMGDVARTTAEQQQAILELEDMDCGNPCGRDLHDSIIAPFRSRDYTALPVNAPARHMHVLDAKAYTSRTDLVIKTAGPRLCDAVATVLAYTSPECLEAFLNPEVEVFEWRRLGNCVMIRREGNEVMVGNYYNFGTMYQWGYLLHSTIDVEGAWSEKWASASQGTTPVGTERVLFEQFESEGTGWDIEPDNEKFALYVGRQLADFLLRWEVWDYNRWWRYKVEWEADGKVTNAREKNRYPAGLTFD